MVEVSIQPVGDWGAAIGAKLRGVSKDIESVMLRRNAAVSSMVKSEVMSNFHALSMGGTVRDSDGFSVVWSRHRAARTVAIRRQAGLGALYPILSLTGKLERGLTGGSVRSNARGFSYMPASDTLLLIASHQFGQAPLPSRHSATGRGLSPGVNMPPRKIVFWSKRMVDRMKSLIQADVKSRHGGR